MLQDRVPYVLGPRPRFVLDRVEPGGRREVSYRVRSDLRGRYPLGPLQLRLTDPFGMCELTRSFSTWDTLTVVPPVEALPPGRSAGRTGGYGEGRQRALALAGDDDVIPRGYRHGDDLRRVHWRSTARYGELMVRREEQPQQARCTVLLDTRRAGYPGSGPDSPFEWAVAGAASVCVHLLERGCSVRLLTDTGAAAPGPENGGFLAENPDTAGLLLETPSPSSNTRTSRGWPEPTTRCAAGDAGQPGLLIAFLGALDEEQALTVGRLRQRSDRAVAFVATPAGRPQDGTGQPAADTAEPPGTQAALRVLHEAGWTALTGGPGTPLAALWQEAEHASAKGAER